MNKIKAKIMYFERVQGMSKEFIRITIFPQSSQHAIEALINHGFRSCGREHWMRKRKAYQKNRNQD